MQAASPTRTNAVFRALLPDGHSGERDELRASGVSASRIASLYPHDFATLTDALHVYMRSGGRIALHHSEAFQRSITDPSRALSLLLPRVAISEHKLGFDERWAAIDATAQAIALHPAATFCEVEGNTLFNGPHKQQGVALIARLSLGLLYAQHLSADPLAGTYLGALADTYLPDLLAS